MHEVNERAFGQVAEAKLVEALRRTADPQLSLVAETEGQIIGHIFFSPVELEPARGAVAAMGLAPMAVLPEHQRRGVGSMLVRKGLQACKQRGVRAVVVLGHPKYYPRFGFKPAREFGLQCEYDVPAEAFMVMELKPGALAGRRSGTVKYHAAFDEIG